MKKTQFCCETYKKMALTFNWFSYVNEHNERIFCLPSIEMGDNFLRVNHCPSCGTYTRSIEVPEDEYMAMMNYEKVIVGSETTYEKKDG